ncbi:MAG: efflux RND transporter permease subunit [Candidatus Sericytochromatia bacterium]|nr:efflux RND transporter permease subunit [Candidatus Tanganyikabacteria bacterium]
MNFSAPFIRRPVLTSMLMLVLAVLGAMSFGKLSVDLFPDVDFPVVVVTVPFPGAAPQEVEALVAKPVEEVMAGTPGLKALSSTSREGVAIVVAQFRLDADPQAAAADVRDKVAGLGTRLPADARTPAVQVFDPASEPIMTFAFSGGRPERVSAFLRERVRPRLEALSGVAAVRPFGERTREVRVLLEPSRLAAERVTSVAVLDALRAWNVDMPGGRVEEAGRLMTLRTLGRARSVEELGDIGVRDLNGGVVPLSRVARIRDDRRRPVTAALVDGQPAVVFGIVKARGANAVRVSARVREALAALEPELPAGVGLVSTRDQTEFIREANLSVWEHTLVGGLLAVAVLHLFLRSRAATFIGGLAIPLSILGTFWLMQRAGFSFNQLTNLGLSMVVGILVDDAVVDLENVWRHIERGEEPIRAAIDATAEIQLAVTATTMAIVAVFIPVAFMDGLIGRFFEQFGWTVAFAVLVSLLIARTVTPMLSARMLRPAVSGAGEDQDTGFRWAAPYRRLLGWALGHRRRVLAVALLSFVAGLALVPFIPKSFLEQADAGEFMLTVKAPKGSSLQQTLTLAQGVERLVRARSEVRTVLTQIGVEDQTDLARIHAVLRPRSERGLTDVQVAHAVRDEAQALPGVRTSVMVIGMVAQGDQNYPIYVQLRSEDLDALARISSRLVSALRRHPGLVDIDSSLGSARPELRLVPDRGRMAALGLSPGAVASTLRLATEGETATNLTLDDEEVPVRVALDDRVRGDALRWAALEITGLLGPVSLGQVVSVRRGAGYAEIERLDRGRVATVVGNLRPGMALGDGLAIVAEEVAKIDLPPEVTISLEGQAKDMAESFTGLVQALLLAVLFIYVILAVQFESFIHPFTIMLSLPLSVVGAFLGLFLTGTELGITAMIGVIMLMGIVTKNAILLVDVTLSRRAAGMAVEEALLAAAPVRLRPILMTTAAMVMGMMPMAFRLGAGSEYRYPMAIVVIGGLLVSTLLTLVVIPVAFAEAEQWAERFRRRSDPARIREDAGRLEAGI